MARAEQDRLGKLAIQVASNTESLKRLQATQERILQALQRFTDGNSNGPHSRIGQDASDRPDILEDAADIMNS